jgi:hypothetical protein
MFAVHIFIAFFVIALAGVPLVYALLVTTIGMIWAKGLSHPLETIFLSYIGGVEPFILIAVPLFVFAGEPTPTAASASASSSSRGCCSVSAGGSASSPSPRA